MFVLFLFWLFVLYCRRSFRKSKGQHSSQRYRRCRFRFSTVVTGRLRYSRLQTVVSSAVARRFGHFGRFDTFAWFFVCYDAQSNSGGAKETNEKYPGEEKLIFVVCFLFFIFCCFIQFFNLICLRKDYYYCYSNYAFKLLPRGVFLFVCCAIIM